MTPSRRRVLAAASGPLLGIVSLRLPAAAVAASGGSMILSLDAPTVVADDMRLMVTWTETPDADHAVEISTDGGSTWTTAVMPATSPATATGLTNGVDHTVRIATVSGGVTHRSATSTGRPEAAASGGTETTIDLSGDGDLWRVHSFTPVGTSTLTVRAARDVEYLVVAGGGAGGRETFGGGGGGAGGLLTNVGGTPLAVTVGAATIVVGAGGTATTGTEGVGGDGGSSSAFGVTTTGGGGGGGGGSAGRSGGSGGGGSGSGEVVGLRNPGTGASGQGRSGGSGALSYSNYAGGGGGGAVGVGGASTGTAAGAGGAGRTSAITGMTATYAIGGAGALQASREGSVVISPPTASTGGGGRGSSATAPAAGADGIVVIRYRI